MIGLKPEFSVRDSIVAYLKDNELSIASREVVISNILKNQAYHDRLFQINVDLLLNGMGYDEIVGVQQEYSFVRDFYYQQGDTFLGQFIGYEVEKLDLLLEVLGDYRDGKITLNEYFRRMSFNLIYDEINMGSENFVISCFENLFKRYPTENEKNNGVQMVDGVSVQILRSEGRTKVDFLNIITEDPEFYQGRVLDAFSTLLLRDPSSLELAKLTSDYIAHGNYGLMQTEIIKSDEYAGF